MLHRDLLLPFMALPASKPNSLDTSLLLDGNQPSLVNTSSLIDNTGQVDLAGTSSEEEDSSAVTIDAVNVPARPSDKYVVPQKKTTLNPLAIPFRPRPADIAQPRVLPSRTRRRPTWQTSGDWIP